jgi:hypothetical protein
LFLGGRVIALVESENGQVEEEAVDPELVEAMRAAFRRRARQPHSPKERPRMYSVGDTLA